MTNAEMSLTNGLTDSDEISIGELSPYSWKSVQSVTLFFYTNGITALANGGIMVDVDVYFRDFDRARALLKTNRPADPAFVSPWCETK
jgi:hypothetical protein